LVVYINPPYAEIAGKKIGVNLNKIHDKYHTQLDGANRELFAQFLIRIYNEIPDCMVAEFSKIKTLSGSHFKDFRENFKAKLLKGFLVPAWSFDNVKGRFPIGFKVWNTSMKEKFKEIVFDVYDENRKKLDPKEFSFDDNFVYFSKWVNSFKLKSGNILGWLEGVTRNDFQSQNGIIVLNKKEQIAVPRGIVIYEKNFIECCVCFAVRKVIPATWLNDRDQFLYPNDGLKNYFEFQNDCLAYTLFNNNIQSKYGINHWIPFTEYGVGAKEKFKSHFMTDFIKGDHVSIVSEPSLFYNNVEFGDVGGGSLNQPRIFSQEAKNVVKVGGDVWRHYHKQTFPTIQGGVDGGGYNVNASLYDIREHFQKRNIKGILNSKSIDDDGYNELIGNLRSTLNLLAAKLEPKIYEYGFLKK
jgi:hypothetical protein